MEVTPLPDETRRKRSGSASSSDDEFNEPLVYETEQQGTEIKLSFSKFHLLSLALWFITFLAWGVTVGPTHSIVPDASGPDHGEDPGSGTLFFFCAAGESCGSALPVYLLVMIIFGYGLMRSYIHEAQLSAIGFTFFIALIALPLVILFDNLWPWLVYGDTGFETIPMNTANLVGGLRGALVCVISFGALVGKVAPTQLLIIVPLEVIVYSLAESALRVVTGTVAFGGSASIHLIGAIFGFVLSLRLKFPDLGTTAKCKASVPTYMSVFLGLFVILATSPFVGGIFPVWFDPQTGDSHEFYKSPLARYLLEGRPDIFLSNTILATFSGAMMSFVISRVLHGRRKIRVMDVAQGTIASVAAVSSVAAFSIRPIAIIFLGQISAAAGLLFIYKVFSSADGHGSRLDSSYMFPVHFMGGLIGELALIIVLFTQDIYVSGDMTDSTKEFVLLSDVIGTRPGPDMSFQVAELVWFFTGPFISAAGAVGVAFVCNVVAPRWSENQNVYFDDGPHWGLELPELTTQ